MDVATVESKLEKNQEEKQMNVSCGQGPLYENEISLKPPRTKNKHLMVEVIKPRVGSVVYNQEVVDVHAVDVQAVGSTSADIEGREAEGRNEPVIGQHESDENGIERGLKIIQCDNQWRSASDEEPELCDNVLSGNSSVPKGVKNALE